MSGKWKNIPRMPIKAAAIIGLCLVLSAGAWVKTSGALSPGPLSAIQLHGENMQGYTSHAEFEQQCSHCHAPMHCIEDNRCQACHIEIARERTEAEGLHSRLPGTDRCQNCHTEHQGREADITEFAFANIDHAALTGYSLQHHQVDFEGELLNCEACHRQDRFIQSSLDCITCHAAENPAYMQEHRLAYGDGCLQCHDGRGRMQFFDHNQIYPLTGGHAAPECADCHLEHRYTDTPVECAACHADPEIHLGVFGEDCARCHTINSWQNAKLVEHTFRLDHGENGRLECETCHIQTYTDYTCYGCHDHQAAEIEQFHKGQEITTLEPCGECHPTGVEKEAERLQAGEGWQSPQFPDAKPEDERPSQADGNNPEIGKGGVSNEKNTVEPAVTEWNSDPGAGSAAGNR
jgi:hypothetical protein